MKPGYDADSDVDMVIKSAYDNMHNHATVDDLIPEEGTMENGELFQTLKRGLQNFQSKRLNKTYEDIKNDPEYDLMGDFFFNRLYAPEDFTFRDEGMKKLHRALDGKVYAGMVSAVSKVIELHDLTDQLDNLMVQRMIDKGIGADITMEQYQMIYRSLDNYDQRIYQIDLSTHVTRLFHALSRKWIVALSLKTVKKAAFFFKVKPVVDFIYQGYDAFRHIKNIDYFVNTIHEREISWHNEIWNKADLL
ncbi:hypothetical protein MTBBW1_2140002 [Desulfamplus magnetovallimortis]|uniref:DUF8198 domain-containing protein n=1 Tax=Desulfamplus magnetovallimortis TaxID=1246637 RepID=A0A1W1HCJ8_9BACT|nr:hypothetical protein [Desulfamplus magnetovallimortis]SLM30207.1 hypothetical protein MTBBW1_2140002 [Desulfamplus magnetovallimortis]